MKKLLIQLSCVLLFSLPLWESAGAQSSSPVPSAPGQAAFGAISEIVHILQADSSTDWSRVNIEALRQHLIDMDAVVLRAQVNQQNAAGGIEVLVTGAGATVASIQRLATNHAQMLNTMSDYRTTVTSLPTGVRLSVVARDPNNAKTVARIRGLGFAGLLTEGSHHQPHHLAIARGAMVHRH